LNNLEGNKLHLGCGNKHIPGFINIDTRKLESVDLVDDIKTLATFANNSIDLIYASHVLVHVGRLEYMPVLKRWYDVIKPDGTLRIAVPDIEQVVKHYSKFGDLKLLRGLLWGGQTYAENHHYMGWDFSTLRDDLIMVGFKTIYRYNWQTTEHSHIDDFSQCYLPHMDKENGMLMSPNVEAVK
jgi:ubiquinone/menaquinone biosynthesis C-methylase UbiE